MDDNVYKLMKAEMVWRNLLRFEMFRYEFYDFIQILWSRDTIALRGAGTRNFCRPARTIISKNRMKTGSNGVVRLT